MRRYLIFAVLLWAMHTAAQQANDGFRSVLSGLETKGWKIQHEAISTDGQTLYLSAKEPGETCHNLYISRRTEGKWATPQLMSGPCLPTQDELWPSISVDEQALYFVRDNDIYVTRRSEEGWSAAERLIVSNGGCICPLILEDDSTLIFASCKMREEKHPQYGIYYTQKVSKYHWRLPKELVYPEEKKTHYYAPRLSRNADQQWMLQYTVQTTSRRDTSYRQESMPLEEIYAPKAGIQIRGQVRDIEQKPLQATVYVEDAITATRIATHRTYGAEADFVLSLPHGRVYNLDFTTPGYSHRYLSYDTRQIASDSTAIVQIELSPTLNITVNLFDQETHLPVQADRIKMNVGSQQVQDNVAELTLPIGEECRINFSKAGYDELTLDLDTRKKVLLPSSVLDIEFRPGKAPVSIVVCDAKTQDTIQPEIGIRNLSHPEQTLAYHDSLQLRQGDSYDIALRQVGYLFFDTTVIIPLSPEPVEYRLWMHGMERNMIMQLRNIQFAFASFALSEDSYAELDKVVQLMQDNPQLCIELSAHTDDKGADGYNMRLSQRRGESARRYIVRQGIDPTRITAKGYGKTQPLMPNNSEENRAINRRVEFKIIGL